MSIQSPTIEELHDAALMVAQLMQKEGCETLAPLFARLKAELDQAKEKASVIDHAREFLAANKGK